MNKTRAAQIRQWMRRDRRRRRPPQSPPRTVWGNHGTRQALDMAVERYASKRCDGTCTGDTSCAVLARLTALRTAYRRRR